MIKRDTTPIFGAVAPSYWGRNIPVIPLHYHDKRPVPTDWSRFHAMMPSEDEQNHWLQIYGHYNVGLVLGQQAGMAMIDIDTTEETLVQLILRTLRQAAGGKESPWVRIGKKGMVLAFRYNPNISTFRVKDTQGDTLVEYLSARTQVVLPPSIHPETKKPYTSNVELIDVVEDLPLLNPEIESILRGALKEEGVELSVSGWTKVTDWTPVGARDVQMTKVAGHYAYGVVRGELPLLEAIERMKAWWATCAEKVAGDDVDIEKGIINLVKFVKRDVIEKSKVLPRGWDEGLSDEDKDRLGLNFTVDQQEWAYDELKDYLHQQFEKHEPDSPGRVDAINYVLSKIAKASSLNSLDEDRLLRYICDAGGMRMTMASLRKRIREINLGEVKGANHTEIARAVKNDLEQYGPIHFHGSRFWTWNGSHWQVKPEQELYQMISDQYGHLDAARRFSDHRGILQVLANSLPQGLCETEIQGVNFANGVLTQQGELRPHDPKYGMTYTLPFRYVPELAGSAFKFQEFLEQCWGEDEDFQLKVNALQEAMCATMFGLGPNFQRAVLLFGAPKTGKSQLLTIVSSLVPDEARASCPPDQWNDKFAPATMHEKLINVCGELSERRPIDGQRFKDIVDGNEIQGQFKGQQIFRFKPRCLNWFASNHLPRTDDTSAAFNRRWLTLSFTRQVPEEKRELNLGEKIIAEEREAIAAWAVEAMPRLMERREYTLPPSHHEIMNEVASMNNSVRFFILESGKVGVTPVLKDGEKTSPHTSEMKLHNAYFAFCCAAGGVKPVGPKQFRQQMRELGSELGFRLLMKPTVHGTLEPVYAGITLVDGPAG